MTHASVWRASGGVFSLTPRGPCRLVEALAEESQQLFVATAKDYIVDASALVDMAATADIPNAEASPLYRLCEAFSRGTVAFVHAARGRLFDRDNDEVRDRFDKAALALDTVLDDLLDMVLLLMAKYSQAGVKPPLPPKPRMMVMAAQADAVPLPAAAAAGRSSAPVERPPSPTSAPTELARPASPVHAHPLSAPVAVPARPPAPRHVVPLPATPTSESSSYEFTSSPALPPRQKPATFVAIPALPSVDQLHEDKPTESPRLSPDLSVRRSPRAGRSSAPSTTAMDDAHAASVGSPKILSPRVLLTTLRNKMSSGNIGAPSSSSPGTGGGGFGGSSGGAELRLHRCAASGDAEALKQLLAKAKRDPGMRGQLDARNTSGLTALHLSIRHGHAVAALLLVASGASLDLRDPHGALPLHMAAAAEMYDVCTLMMDRGASTQDLHSGAGKSVSFIEMVLMHDPSPAGVAAIESALANKAKADGCTKRAETLLHLAAGRSWTGAIAPLLTSNAINLNAVDDVGETCLHKAVRVGNVDIVRALVEAGVDQTVCGRHGTAYQLASQPGIKALLRAAPPTVSFASVVPPVDLGAAHLAPTSAPVVAELSPREAARGRAITVTIDDLQAMASSEMSNYFAAFDELDTQAARLLRKSGRAVSRKADPRVSPRALMDMSESQAASPLASRVSLGRNGVFEEYSGAMFELETGRKGVVSPSLTLDTDIEPFRQRFYGRRLLFFITQQWNKDNGTAVLVLNPQLDAGATTFSSLLISSTGEQALDLSIKAPVDPSDVKHFRKQLETSFTPGKRWKHIEDRAFGSSLLALETSHSRSARCYRFGVVFAEPNQKEEAVMFTNRAGSPGFMRFLRCVCVSVLFFRSLSLSLSHISLIVCWAIAFHSWVSADTRVASMTRMLL